jgi:hypothetical protein
MTGCSILLSGGSTLEAMALAVERAAVVLVCLSQGYKDSPSCRTGKWYDLVFVCACMRMCVLTTSVSESGQICLKDCQPLPSLEMGRVASGRSSSIKFLP